MTDVVKARYVGPHTEGVEIEGQFCAHGDTIEVSPEVADGLAEQDSWEVAGKKRAQAAKAKRANAAPVVDEVDAAPEPEDTTTGDTADEQGA